MNSKLAELLDFFLGHRFTFGEVLYHAMHEKIRIAANRRREVRVVLKRESEVTNVFGGIHCLGHGAERRGFNEVLFRFSFNLIKKFIKVGTFYFTVWRNRELIAHDFEELRKVCDAVSVRKIMDAVDSGGLKACFLSFF